MRSFSLISLLMFVAIGCSSRLETGYKPKALGVTDDARKGYYAPPFSPESQAAHSGEVERLKMRRPDGY